MRVLIIFGTRPEAIKMAPVILALKQEPNVETLVCVTAQHREMLDDALDVFGIQPDYDLNIMRVGQTLDSMTSALLGGVTRVIKEVRPDRVVVHGDTTTTFVATLASFYSAVPVGHVEAGLRTGNLNAPWPEEFNRRAVDIVADLLWAPTDNAADVLIREGANPENVHVTGNSVIDALRIAKSLLDADQSLYDALWSKLPAIVDSKRLVLVTGHRRESFGGGLSNICHVLNRLARLPEVAIVWPIHLNPNVLAIVNHELEHSPDIHVISPQNYLSFVALMERSRFIITDSGGIQEEAPVLRKPVLVARDETERSEAIEAGTARLVGTSAERIYEVASELLYDENAYERMCEARNPFGDGYAAERIVDSLLEKHGLLKRDEVRSVSE